MEIRKYMGTLLAGCVFASVLTGCNNAASTAADQTGQTTQQTEEGQPVANQTENQTTGDASLDNPRNQDEIGENELLVVSFGTSYNESRRLTIGAIETVMEQTFPSYAVRRGFTSQTIIDRVKERDQVSIDNVEEALQRAAENGVKNLVVQPTHLMDGLEYHDLVNEVAARVDSFERVAVGQPLLASDEDFLLVAKAITAATKEYDDGKTAICFMGHGTEAASNGVYAKMQQCLTDAGYENYFIGTVEASPTLEDVINAVKAKDCYHRVVLRPLMIVAGDHASNDMAGDEEDSWKSVFEKEGFAVTPIISGLGELPEIQALFAAHAQKAIEEMQNNPLQPLPSDTGADSTDGVTVESLALTDGSYTVSVALTGGSGRAGIASPAALQIKDKKATVRLVWSSDNYDYMKVDDVKYDAVIEDGHSVFEIPFNDFDRDIPVIADTVAMSSPREIEYSLRFDAASVTLAAS